MCVCVCEGVWSENGNNSNRQAGDTDTLLPIPLSSSRSTITTQGPPYRYIHIYIHTHLKTTTTGLSLLVTNINPFQIIRALKTIMAKLSDWERSIRGDFHSFFNSDTWPWMISSIFLFVCVLLGVCLVVEEGQEEVC